MTKNSPIRQSPASRSDAPHRPAGPGPRRAVSTLGGALMGAFLGTALIGAPALAQDTAGSATPTDRAAPEQASPRYAFAPVEGGALKLDRQTGKVSLCAKGPAGFTCEAVPDSRDAYEAEIARLQKELAALRTGTGPNAGTGTAPDSLSELDQALDYAERIYRRLRGMIEGLNKNPAGQQSL